MACGGGVHDLKWSNRTYRIREVIRHHEFTLPVLVKVEEGIYGSQASESFSQDDLLKLDLVKSIPKVVACCVDHLGRNMSPSKLREDENGYLEMTKDLTIPLRYQGLVNIFQPEAETMVYHSVGEMVKHFPRYVQTVDSFLSKNNVSVDGKTVIELDRIIPGEGLMCTLVTDRSSDDCYSNTTQILLDVSAAHEFSLVPDNNDYTLEQITSRFPLPQYVRFVKESGPKLVTTNIQEVVEHSDIFEGTVKIKRTVDMDVIIGHYKPPEAVTKLQGGRCQRTLVIIPVDSYIAREIEVRVHDDDDDDMEYELVVAKNFTRKDIREEEIDGTIYVDFLKTPKASFVDYEEVDICPVPERPSEGRPFQVTPPPLPPKPGHRMGRQQSLGMEEQGKTAVTGDPPQDRPPPRPPKRVSLKKGPDSTNDGVLPLPPKPPPRPERVLSLPDSDIDDYEEIDDPVQPPGLTDDDKSKGYVGVHTKGTILENVPETHRFSLSKVHKDLMKYFKKKTSFGPSDQLARQAEKTRPPLNKNLPGKVSKTPNPSYTSLPEKTTMTRHPSNASLPGQTTMTRHPSNASLPGQTTITRHPSNISLQNIDASSDQTQSKSDCRKWFESLKPSDLYQHLMELKLIKMASTCRDEELDGLFFNSITDDQLKEDFKLTSIQILKFRRFQQEGWMPN